MHWQHPGLRPHPEAWKTLCLYTSGEGPTRAWTGLALACKTMARRSPTDRVCTCGQNNDKKDPNILASHLHGFYGNPGTNASACDPPLDPGVPCWHGDNIFHDILPGACADYQYDFTPYHSPGVFWLHPHK